MSLINKEVSEFSVQAFQDNAFKTVTKAEDTKTPAKVTASASRIYVQLAGGANADQMDREFDRIRKAKPAQFYISARCSRPLWDFQARSTYTDAQPSTVAQTTATCKAKKAKKKKKKK